MPPNARRETAALPPSTRTDPLDQVLAAIVDVVWTVDAARRTLGFRGGARTLFGFPLEELEADGGALFWERVHAEDREALDSALRDFFTGIESLATSFRFTARSGRVMWLEARAVDARRQAETIVADVVVADVTTRKGDEAKAARKSERLAALIAESPVVTCVRRASRHFGPTFVSDAVGALLGYTAATFLRSQAFWPKLLHPDDEARVLDGLRAAQQQEGGSARLEYRMQDREGEWRWIRDDVVHVRSGDGDEELVSYWTDLSERKRWETACQSLEANVSVLFARTPDPAVLCRGGVIALANHAFVEACGHVRSEDVSGLDVATQIDPRDRAALASMLAEAERSLGAPPMVPVRWLRKGGGSVTLRCCALPSSFRGEPAVLVFGASL